MEQYNVCILKLSNTCVSVKLEEKYRKGRTKVISKGKIRIKTNPLMVSEKKLRKKTVH